MSYGVVIGRFQVAELTNGHKELLSHAAADNFDQIIILVGVSPAQPTARNPLPYYVRLAMLQKAWPNAIIAPITDCISDAVWSKRVDELIASLAPGQNIMLYGGRDCFSKSYTGRHSVVTVDSETEYSGTDQRQDLSHIHDASPEFRHGMIHANMNRFPAVFPTVDIAVIKPGGLVLMVGKEGETGWRFPGGFVDLKDTSLELAAKRELREETGLYIEGDLHYVSSRVLDDWRYRQSADAQIMTSFFYGFYSFGTVEAQDDIATFEWMPLSLNPRQVDAGIVRAHHPLYFALQEEMKMGGSEG
jgi:bifunctional NMN adenylyltransferase/nudix hydrolase